MNDLIGHKLDLRVLVVLTFLIAVPAWANGQENSEHSVKVRLLGDPSASRVNGWPGESVLEYHQDAFAFSELPKAYNEYGGLTDWPNPLRIVAEGDVYFEGGDYKVLLRSKRAARLWIDDRKVAETSFPPMPGDGHDPVVRPLLSLGEGVRFLGPGDAESLFEGPIAEGLHRVRLEFFVGGFRSGDVIRPEVGETLVAISHGTVDGFRILSGTVDYPLTDEGWDQLKQSQRAFFTHYNETRRLKRRDTRKQYWDARHVVTKKQAQEKSLHDSSMQNESIDSIILGEIESINETVDTSEEAKYFVEKVRPVLEDKCWTCHSAKAKGGLRLNTLEAALAGGESEMPALVPFSPEKSYLMELLLEEDEYYRMPSKEEPLSSEQIETISTWIRQGAVWPKTLVNSLISVESKCNDTQFIRRVYLDTVGVVPSESAVRKFIADRTADKRTRLIDELLEDSRWADHWVSYWQDVLAENPTIINPTANNTGPFRYWMHDALKDNLPIDRFVTELLLMEGSTYGGGAAGFGLATEADVPMAEKANIVSTAFLATQMKCSRCHDAPFHNNTQKDLFSLAALLAEKPLTVPKSSSVPMDKLHSGGRKPLINVTLAPGSVVQPEWPFPPEQSQEEFKSLLMSEESLREKAALHVTLDPRFPKVMANRLWGRFFARAIVEPVDDWENPDIKNAKLLDYLARKLVESDYDLKFVARLILNSDCYQRDISTDQTAVAYFAAQGARRMQAEQIVDSLFAASGKEFDSEILTIDIAGDRLASLAVNLGEPNRAWMFGGMANNRDRPSLTLPRSQAFYDVLTAFGWRGTRQEPTSYRQDPLSPLKPAIISNGTMASWLTRLSDDSELTEISLIEQPVEELISSVYLRFLGRMPTPREMGKAANLLAPGYEVRIQENQEVTMAKTTKSPLYVTWENHLHPDASEVAQAAADAARTGYEPTRRLSLEWREKMEDFIWAVINLPETVYYK